MKRMVSSNSTVNAGRFVLIEIFNALNSLELKSLEEPIYLFGQFFQKPLECLTLAYYLPQNAGAIARKYIQDPQLLSFIDAECFIVSTVNALQTPMINASMVLCDRHFGGINYPVGGVGGIAKSLAKGLVDQGSQILYKANVTSIITEQGKAVGVRLSDGREFFAKTIISNATRWDTFGKLIKEETLPKEEENFQKVYVKAPSFLSIHMGVKAEVLPLDTECHHFVLEDNWTKLEEPYGSIFLSIPTILDSSLAPEGRHILHIFTTSSMDDWKGLSKIEYEAKKQVVADEIISRLEKKLFPGLKSSIEFIEVGTPKTHRRYLARDEGTYGPMPRSIPKGLLGMPFNTTSIDGLYCVGDSCFPGQGVIAVAFSGVMCAHRVAADIGLEKKSPVLDAMLLRLLGWFRTLA
ncbi:prolycopene isomerase, chloroplastic-like isoform X2 [Vicia villosa]|uniref:prolycopene isomerase, chloroplastic-like isoform X2 n=1 Tax=Vicia villosa TaxID=3911 RepID=UPI00273C40D6|nr:prolycopene isomerase, chloroplastic-like isoform X2 [Vicia villosa]